MDRTDHIHSSQAVLLLAAWFGLASGAIEGILYYVFQEMGWLSWEELLLSVDSRQIVVSAAFNVVLFLCIAGLATAAMRLFHWRQWPFVIYGLFLFLSLLPLVDLSGRIQMRAAAVLAFGLAVQLARFAARQQAMLQASMRKTLPFLGCGLALAAIGLWAGRAAKERMEVHGLPVPAHASPNILLIVLDTVRFDHLSAYGYERQTTPTIERLAKEGILFERAYAASSWTLPSHASMFTGLLPSEHGAQHREEWKPLGTQFPVLGETLQDYGYVTGGFVSNTIWLIPYLRMNRGFQHYESIYHSWSDALVRGYYGRQIHRWFLRRILKYDPFFRRTAPSINDAVLRYVASYEGRPFFVFINYMEAHQPIMLPASHQGTFKGGVSGNERTSLEGAISASQLQVRNRMLGEYDRALNYLDLQIDNLLQGLKRQERLENTVVIITSDHREMFGEHGLFDHGNSAYEEVVRVPLIFWFPAAIPVGGRVSHPVSQVDILPTVLEIVDGRKRGQRAGLLLQNAEGERTAPPRAIMEVDGADLPAIPKEWPVRRGWLKAIVAGDWKLILHEREGIELYNLADDPGELHNLARDPKNAERIDGLVPQLRQATAH